MKLIETVVSKTKLQEVRNVLDELGVEEFLESAIIAHGSRKEQVMIFRGAKFPASVVEKVKLELIATDEAAERIIAALAAVARTGGPDECRVGVRAYLEVA